MQELPVDILMYCRSGASGINETIGSVLAQDHPHFKLFIILDGHTGNSSQELQNIQDARIVPVLFESPVGRSAALNWALAEVTSEYIAFTDAGCHMHPDRISRQLKCLLNSRNIDVCGSHVGHFHDDDNILRLPSSHEEIVAQLIFSNPLRLCAVMLRSSIFLKEGYRFRDRYKYLEDHDLFYRIKDSKRFANLREQLTEVSIEYEKSLHSSLSYKENARSFFVDLLNNFGISPTEKELDLHMDLHDLETAERVKRPRAYNRWLETLRQQNEKKHHFPSAQFNHVLSVKWRQIFSHVLEDKEAKIVQYLKLSGKKDLEIFIYLLKHRVRKLFDAAAYMF